MTMTPPQHSGVTRTERGERAASTAGVRRVLSDPANLVLAAIVLVAVVVGLSTERFVTVDNAKAICVSTGTIGIAALGATLITISGGLVSLAIGQTAVVGGMVFLMTLDLGLIPALVLAMLVGGAVTAVQGWAIGAWRVNPIILTIAIASILTSVGSRLSASQAVSPASNAFESLNGTPAGVPVVVFALIGLTVVVQVVLRTTRLGRLMYAVGENRDAAVAAGLPVAVTTTVAFAVGGALMAVSGSFSAATSHTITLAGANQLTFDATAAVLAGGTAIAGGFGSATRTLLGALLIATISDLLLLRGADVGLQTLVKGLLVLLVVVMSHIRSRRSRT